MNYLRILAQARGDWETLIDGAVWECRRDGHTWTAIAQVLGTNRRQVWKRYTRAEDTR